MANKAFLVESAAGERVPFLRGILVQSLVDAGLSFTHAYAIANRLRNQLDGDTEVLHASELRRLVGEELERRFGSEVRGDYDAGGAATRVVVRRQGGSEPFSTGVLARHLEGCGIRSEVAARGAAMVHANLREQGLTQVGRKELRQVVYGTLKSGGFQDAGNRFLSRCHFNDSGEPLIVLIGGATGAGKSTLATRLAYLLDIVRTQSTDMMREIIRCYLVPHVAPTLSYSSFDAWRGLPQVEGSAASAQDPVVAGFLAQFGTVRVALEATISRAVKERTDLIVDGVHVLPTYLNLTEIRDKAVLVPLVLAVTTRKRLDEQFKRRSREAPDRDSDRHREMLSEIWTLQTFMVDQAQKADIPVLVNWDMNETVSQVMDEVMRCIGERFPPHPELLA
jgi:2-phosphoglycerate kinase